MSLSNSSDAYTKANALCTIINDEIEFETLSEKKALGDWTVIPILNYLRTVESHCELIRRILSEKMS